MFFVPAVILAVLASAGIIYLLVNWPFAKQRLIDALQESSVRTVTIGRFRRTYFPPGCVAEDIRFLHRRDRNKPPLITVQTIVVEGSYLGLITFPKRLTKVLVQGMHVTVPPTQPGETNPVMPLTDVKSERPIVIGTVIADGTVLDFISSRQGNERFQLVVEKLALEGVGNNKPILYKASIQNSEPPGLIQSTGRVGPWVSDDPGQTPVIGSFSFEHANVGVFSGLSGILSSGGQFSGRLAQIKVSGNCEVPNLHVAHSAHAERLMAAYQATVNANNGDTLLDQIQSTFNRTVLVSKGAVSGAAGSKGKVVTLDVTTKQGRIEDLLDMFLSAPTAALTGSINARARVIVPPGPMEFLQKIDVEGDFGLSDGKFTNHDTQNVLNKLSSSAEQNERKAEKENPETALYNLKGHITAKNGLATLTGISFSMPGADAQMHGTFNLLTEEVNLHGVLVTDGKLWAATNGFKSLLMHALTPFLKHSSHATSVPFKITGKYPAPSVALDLFAKE
jgi:AsmA-like C-terminal region